MKRRVLGPTLIALTVLACADPASPSPDGAGAAVAALLSSSNSSLQITLQDVGVPFGAGGTWVSSINERGDIGGGTVGAPPQRGFLWSSRLGFTDVGNLGGPGGTIVNSLNASGRAVGASDRLGGLNQSQAFLWSAQDGMRDLLPGVADQSQAFAINDQGSVAGSIGHPAFVVDNPQPFLWTERDGLVLPDLLPDWLGANGRAINNGGQIVGEAKVPVGAVNEIHAFVWSVVTGMIDLGRVGPIPSFTGLLAINERGDAVGGRRDANGTSHAIFWNLHGGMVDLDPPGAITSSASDINNRGQVVGNFATGSGTGRAFLWSATTGFVELPGLSTGPNFAFSVNEAGEIAGRSLAADGLSHVVVWRLRGSP